jgi:acetyl esterase
MPLDPAAAQVLSLLEELGLLPFEAMTPVEAREVAASLRDPSVTGPEMADVRDLEAAGVPVRVYTPNGKGPFGILVWFHGGGWVIGSVADSDVTARELAGGAGVVVVSVDYRLAPEHRFPAAVDDCVAVTQWVLANAAELGGDTSRVAVGGDSAGGNLAAIVTQELRGQLAFQLLVYPATDASMSTPSCTENGEGYLLTTASMEWFYGHYLEGTGTALTDVRLSPLATSDWSGLPPALIITAEFDPLRDEGEAYAAKLAAAGVEVTTSRYDGMIHAFFTLGAMIPAAKLAMDEATTALRSALSR